MAVPGTILRCSGVAPSLDGFGRTSPSRPSSNPSGRLPDQRVTGKSPASGDPAPGSARFAPATEDMGALRNQGSSHLDGRDDDA